MLKSDFGRLINCNRKNKKEKNLRVRVIELKIFIKEA